MILFFFKQKTAYEMRISDWSSDVCSSDLERPVVAPRVEAVAALAVGQQHQPSVLHCVDLIEFIAADILLHQHDIGALRRPGACADGLFLEGQLLPRPHRHRDAVDLAGEIGRAWWRERVCQYV